jgi:lipoate---protein ligase
MLCIIQKDTDPLFNIASEEYFLRNFSDDILILYRNSPSVIIGKHQNTFAEVDYNYAYENNISIVRRLSGGGSVYHDLGNVNFTFIRNGIGGALVDFKGFTKPVIEGLAKLGVEATYQGQNSLYVKGKKFSGNAEHVFKQRVMHHGTLLFSTDHQTLAKVLYVDLSRFSDKAVKSVRANTTNLIEHISPPLTIDDFINFLYNHLKASFGGAKDYAITSIDAEAIQTLVQTKYYTWEWNFGYSPTFSFSREIFTSNGTVFIEAEVDKGILKSLQINGNGISSIQKDDLIQNLQGCTFKPEVVYNLLNATALDKDIKDKLLSRLF